MRKILWAVTASMALIPTIASADVPNIVGTWKGQTTATVYGSGGHHPSDLGGGITYRAIEATYVFENQQGLDYLPVLNNEDSW